MRTDGRRDKRGWMPAPRDYTPGIDRAAILTLLRRYRLALIAFVTFLVVLTRPLWGPEDPATTFARETLDKFSELEVMLSDIGSLLDDASEERQLLMDQAKAVNLPSLIVAATDLKAALDKDMPFDLQLAAYDGVATAEGRDLVDPLRPWSDDGIPTWADIQSQLERVLFTNQAGAGLTEEEKNRIQRAQILFRAGKLSLSAGELSFESSGEYPELRKIRAAIMARVTVQEVRRKLSSMIVRLAGSVGQPVFQNE